MSRFLYGMITGAAMLYVAMHFHIVRGNDGVFLVPKLSNNLSEVYVDIRQYKLRDWEDHKPLAAAILKSNQTHLLNNATRSDTTPGNTTLGNTTLGRVRSRVTSIINGILGDNKSPDT